MASRGPYWYVTVSLLQYIGKPFQARTGVFFDKSLQACRITLFNWSPWPWSRLPSRRRDRIRQESIVEYHGKGHLSRKILILLRFFLRASAPLCWLMEYSFRKKKEAAREMKAVLIRQFWRKLIWASVWQGGKISIQKRIIRKAKSQSTFLTSFGTCYYLWESVNQVQLQYLNELFQRLINLFSSHRISSGLKQFPTSLCLLLREQFWIQLVMLCFPMVVVRDYH